MIWRNYHRADRRKRERIAALQKRPTITTVETITSPNKQQLCRAAWRARHANRPIDNNIETIDLTQETERTPNPENIEQTESPSTVYTATITKLFTRIEQRLLTVGMLCRAGTIRKSRGEGKDSKMNNFTLFYHPF